jgi:hydrogenase expression/formation protein HypD
MRRKLGEILSESLSPRLLTFMEVCGTHTVAIFRSGLRSFLPQEGVRLLSGPGCPVCVTDQGGIDAALSLAERGCIVLTYGDMLRVPGSGNRGSSLQELRSGGARVEVITSAIHAIEFARNNPGNEVVFLAVGFETTAPATAVTLKRAHSLGLSNFSSLCLHKTIPPVLRALCATPGLKVDGFILPGNVTLVAGMEGYSFLPDELGKAAAVAGFEPEEILSAIVDLTRQAVRRKFRLSAYRIQDVPRTGNPVAREALSEVFEVCDARWRGLGLIPESGYCLKGDYARFDAFEKFGLPSASPGRVPAEYDTCRCGEILSGLLTPPECELFGTICTPLSPAGPCMASSEGTCGTWYRFNRRNA